MKTYPASIAHTEDSIQRLMKNQYLLFNKKVLALQAALCVLAGVTDMATANNTVAIIVDGNMARSISEKYKIDPRKTASILDAFTCIFQGMIPYGAQFLLVASLTKGRVSPLDIIPLLWYLFLLGLFTVLSFLIPSYEKLTLSGEWDWENHTVIR